MKCRLILVALKPIYFQILRIMLSLLRMKKCLEEEEDYLDYLLGNENEKIQDPDEVW